MNDETCGFNQETFTVQPGRSPAKKKNTSLLSICHADNLINMLNGVIRATYFHEEPKSATLSEKYVEWGNNSNVSS